jgi:hypothetical protein
VNALEAAEVTRDFLRMARQCRLRVPGVMFEAGRRQRTITGSKGTGFSLRLPSAQDRDRASIEEDLLAGVAKVNPGKDIEPLHALLAARDAEEADARRV